MILSDAIATFLRVRSLTGPDGRPLYAYRCSDEEFARFEEGLREVLGRGPRWCEPTPATAQAFCLWGAEWWRRNHDGGPWAWEEMLAAIECSDYAPAGPHYLRLQEMVAEGIRRWNRELLRFATGRAFLLTLACEGGLPLKLVRRETAALRHFFKDLLEEVRIFGPMGVPARDLAERTAGRLPRRLRNEVVYELSGNLAPAIWRLQREIGESPNPVEALDRIRPGWREDLPLTVDDAVARALLNNLLLDAADLARGRGSRVKWARMLVKTSTGYRLAGRLVLPGTLQPDEVHSLWPDVSILPRRFEIGVETDDSFDMVGFATRRGAYGAIEREHFVLETVLDGNGLTSGPAAAAARRLVLRLGTGSTHATDAFAGAMPLSELPWVFEDTGEPDEELYLAGEGSTSVRADAAVVAFDSKTRVEPDEAAVIEELGHLEAFDRRLVRVRGTVRFQDVDGNLIVVRTRADRASEGVEYRLRGRSLALSRDGSMVFLGPPAVYAYHPDGIPEQVRTAALEWKSDLRGSQWEPLTSQCVGAGRIRYIREGRTEFSQRITVVPAETEVRFLPSRNVRTGTIDFKGIGLAEIAILAPQGVSAEHEWVGGDQLRLVLSSTAQPPTDVNLLIRWPGRGEARLSLPFPAKRAWFETAGGRPLPNDAEISVDRLGHVRAVVVVPNTNATFSIEGNYRGADVTLIEPRNQLFRQELRAKAPGLYEADLVLLQPALESRLAFSNDEAGHVRLVIRSDCANDLDVASLQVFRFDFQFSFDEERSEIVIPDNALAKLTEEEVLTLRLEAISLIAPTNLLVPLERLSNTRWRFPEGELDPGPWLVLAWHGDWCRARPLWRFLPPAHPEDYSRHPLLEVFRARPNDEAGRRPAARALITRLRTNAADAAWSTIDELLELTTHIPAVTLDPLVALANDPTAAAMAALRAPSDTAFSRLWRALETLPFWWRAIPAAVWETALDAFIDSLEESLDPLREALGDETLEQTIAQRVDAAIARLGDELASVTPVLLRVAARRLGRRPDAQVSTLYDPKIRAHLMRERHQLTEEARDQLSRVPRSVHLDSVTQLATELLALPWSRDFFFQAHRSCDDPVFKRLNAPVVAALCAVTGHKLSPLAIYQLRTLASLVPTWFADVYDRTFWCAVRPQG
ncbi:MAG TPA: STY4851/ECs_5259 family protein [Thermomicrobiales bacterium]|nr:STY4851/ECs_5259 family protein [Thermomicrobiales bacterium]